MRMLTLNECGLVTGGLMLRSGNVGVRRQTKSTGSVTPDVEAPPPGDGGGDSGYFYSGGGIGYSAPYYVGYGSESDMNAIELAYNPSNPSVIDTVPLSSNIQTLPTITVTAPVASTEPTSFQGFLDDAAGVVAGGLCLLGGGTQIVCGLVGVGVADFLKANQELLNSIHTDGAWTCAKTGNCYEYDRANGIQRTPVQ